MMNKRGSIKSKSVMSRALRRITTKSSSPWKCIVIAVIGVFGLISNMVRLKDMINSEEYLYLQEGDMGINALTSEAGSFRREKYNESFVFAYMQQRVKESSEWCHKAQSIGSDTHAGKSKAIKEAEFPQTEDTLSEFGFYDDLSTYFQVKKSTGEANDHDDDSNQCYMPPSKVCFHSGSPSDRYSVVISFQSSAATSDSTKASPHRVLFMNILSIQSYTKAHDILLLYNGQLSDLENDPKYGTRLLSWNSDKDNSLQILIKSEVDDEVATLFSQQLFQFHPHILKFIMQDIILFLDGAQDSLLVTNGGKFGGEASLQAAFELAKQNSRSIVGQDLIEFEYPLPDNASTVHDDIMDRNHTESMQTLLHQMQLEQNRKISNAGFHAPFSDLPNFQNSHFVPICGKFQYSYESMTKEKNVILFPPILRSSTIFLHRDYLCFIWHDSFHPLRSFLDSVEIQNNPSHAKNNQRLVLESVVLSLLISQLSGSAPLLYPLFQQTWIDDDSSNENDTTENKGSRRLLVDQNAHSQLDIRRRSSWKVSNKNHNENIVDSDSQQRRQLYDISKKNVNGKAKYSSTQLATSSWQSILQIMGYFGSIPPRAMSWCTGSKYENRRPISQQHTCAYDNANLTLEMLPWMDEVDLCTYDLS